MTNPAAAPHAYFAFGLHILSDIALAELQADESVAGSTPDLTIRLTPSQTSPDEREGRQALNDLPVSFQHEEASHILNWRAVGSFRIVGTSLIEVDPAPGVEPPLLALPLLGPVMALLLQLRGLLVLHASAIDIGPGAVVFLGDKTAGKSTTAAAFVASGHRLLTDDIVAIDLSGPAPVIRPGFPQLKLDAAVPAPEVAALGDVLPAPVAAFPKRQHRLSQGFSSSVSKVLRFYVLERGADASLHMVAPQEALKALLRFSYTARFGREAMGPEGEVRHFRQCAAMVASAPVKRLEVPTGISRLPEAVALVVHDCG